MTKLQKLGWCYEYVQGRATLEKLQEKIPELTPEFIAVLDEKRVARASLPPEPLKIDLHPNIKTWCLAISHARKTVERELQQMTMV